MLTAIKRRKEKLRNKMVSSGRELRGEKKDQGRGGGNKACLVFCSETGCREHHSGHEETLTAVLVLFR